jgi:Glutamate dehydrogenase/leucine dehydrogenase
VAVSDANGAVYNNAGLPISDLYSAYQEENSFTTGEQLSNDDLLTLDVDVLVPAAIENQITESNMAEIRADAVLEMANGPTTPTADKYLSEQGVPVIPDILANAGGVTVSYFEWVQNTTNDYWSKDRVRSNLETQMRSAFENVATVKRENETIQTWREAAYTRAVTAVLEAETYRSNIPSN